MKDFYALVDIRRSKWGMPFPVIFPYPKDKRHLCRPSNTQCLAEECESRSPSIPSRQLSPSHQERVLIEYSAEYIVLSTGVFELLCA
jgi:hypothetical protein